MATCCQLGTQTRCVSQFSVCEPSFFHLVRRARHDNKTREKLKMAARNRWGDKGLLEVHFAGRENLLALCAARLCRFIVTVFLAHRSTGSNGFVWMSRRRGFSDLNASDRGGVNPVFSLNAYITMLGVTCISLLWRKFTFANFKLKIPSREESIILVQSLISMEPMCHPLTSTTDQNRLKCLLESGFLPLTLCLTVSSLHIFDTDGFF